MVKALMNYIAGSALKKNNDKKHSKADMHLRAVNLSYGNKRTIVHRCGKWVMVPSLSIMCQLNHSKLNSQS